MRPVTSAMGEIRVQVKLTNAVDEAIVRRGGLGPEEVRSDVANAMVDTGAVRSCISLEIAKKLGLAITNEVSVELANGQSELVGVTEPIRFDLLGRSTTEQAWVLGNEVLLGQTLLETTDLLADCAGRRLIPNPEHPEGPVFKAKRANSGR